MAGEQETPEQRLARLLMGQGGGQPAPSPQVLADALVQPPRNPAAPADWAQNAVRGVAGKLADIVMAPRRAMDQGMTTEEAVPWAGDMAMNMAGAGGLGAAPGALGAAGGKLVQPQGIRAYHGSPHDFERFDISKIGTGEGAQSYGHGLYFAENPEVARGYREKLSGNRGFEPVDLATNILQSYKGDRAGAIGELERRIEGSPDRGATSNIPQAIELLRSNAPLKGRMYEVNINAKPEQFLDWDKPLSGQSSQVQESLKGARSILDRGIEKVTRADPTGQYLYSQIGRADPQASSALREAGVPGIKYLDQGSRIPVRQAQDEIGRWQAQLPKAQADLDAAMRQGASQRTIAELQGEVKRVQDGIERVQSQTEGTSNYVLFDDQLIKILRKYGLAGAAPSTAALAEALSKQQGVASQ